jgi:hypothetical protein
MMKTADWTCRLEVRSKTTGELLDTIEMYEETSERFVEKLIENLTKRLGEVQVEMLKPCERCATATKMINTILPWELPLGVTSLGIDPVADEAALKGVKRHALCMACIEVAVKEYEEQHPPAWASSCPACDKTTPRAEMRMIGKKAGALVCSRCAAEAEAGDADAFIAEKCFHTGRSAR